MYLQGSKLTLVRWPVASGGFPVGPVESVLHWPGWPVKFLNPTSEFILFSVNFSLRINKYKYFNKNTDILIDVFKLI